MDGDLSLLSLKWNNHKTAFLHIIGNLRSKSSYTDATLACNGKFYPVHRLVLSTCSEYFCDIFEQTNCKNPVVVLKDVECKNLEYLLDYMYIGEVNVKQNELASLVGAAEYLQIKGLAVPDEDVTHKYSSSHKRSSDYHRGSSPPIKKKRTSRDILELENKNSDKIRLESSDLSQSSGNLNKDKSDFHEPSFIPIKCEPQSDEEIIGDNFDSVSVANLKSKNTHCQLGNKDTNHSESERDIVEKEEPFDLSEDDMNQPGPSRMYENDQYQPNASGSIDSDASLSQIPEEAMNHGSYKPIDMKQQSRGDIEVASEEIFDPGSYMLFCESCSYKSLSVEDLERHKNSQHKDEVFYCSFCSYSSTFKHNLARHIRKHTGEKPFMCTLCTFKTGYQNVLKRHLLNIHQGIH